MEKTIKVFVSYSHQNKSWVDDEGKYALIPWLRNQLKRSNVVFWTDHALDNHIGESYKSNIKKNIADADIAILLISQEFSSSDFILDYELPCIKEAFDNGKLRIVPLLISNISGLGKENISWIFDLQTIPDDKKPIIEFAENDNAYSKIKVKVLDALSLKIENIRKGKREPVVSPVNIQPMVNNTEGIVDSTGGVVKDGKVPREPFPPDKKWLYITLIVVALSAIIVGVWKSGILMGSDASDNQLEQVVAGEVLQDESEPVVRIEEGDADTGNGKGTISFNYGKYAGEIKDFKAHGEGRLLYFKKRKLSVHDPDKIAEPKDVFDGLFENNEPVFGKWLGEDGNQKGVLMTKKTGLE